MVAVTECRFATAEFRAILQGWQDFADHLRRLNVLDAPALARKIDGTRLAKALGVKPGPWMAAALDVCMAWQFRNPTDADVEGAIEEVSRRRDELGIPKPR